MLCILFTIERTYCATNFVRVDKGVETIANVINGSWYCDSVKIVTSL